MAQRDWLVCERYGVSWTIGAGAHLAMPLLPVPTYAAIDPGVPDGDQFDIKVIRIVGQVLVIPTSAGDTLHSWGWRCQPLVLDENAGSVDEPWSVWDADNEDHANLKWWAERRVINPAQQANTAFGTLDVSIPWWAQLDIKPNVWVGLKSRLWPCLLFRNYNLNDNINVIPRLRLYCAYK